MVHSRGRTGEEPIAAESGDWLHRACPASKESSSPCDSQDGPAGCRCESAGYGAWGWTTDLAKPLKDCGVTQVCKQALVFWPVAFLCFFGGWIAASACGITGAGLVLNTRGSFHLSTCGKRLKLMQTGFFQSHTCWFHANSQADWVTADLFRGTVPQSQIGYVIVGSTVQGLHPRASKVDRALEWADRVRTALHAVDDENFGFAFIPQGDLQVFQEETRKWPGQDARRLSMHSLWGNDQTFDSVFERVIGNSSAAAQYVVKLQLPGKTGQLLQGMLATLSSGSVRMLIWTAEHGQGPNQLGKQVDLMSRFGYAVYIASAQSSTNSWVDTAKPAAYLRVDRAFWEPHYQEAMARHRGLRLSLVAVAVGDPFRRVLEDGHMICRKSKNGEACSCDMDDITGVPFSCSLGGM